MLLKKITSIFKYFKDFLIGIYIRSENREEKFKIIYKFSYWKSSTSKSFLDLDQKGNRSNPKYKKGFI